MNFFKRSNELIEPLQRMGEYFKTSPDDKRLDKYSSYLAERNISLKVLSYACRMIIEECKFYPSLSEILQYCYKQTDVHTKRPPGCDSCGHTGRRIKGEIVDDITYSCAYTCNCELGLFYQKSGLYQPFHHA